jgi:hypothetical protein
MNCADLGRWLDAGSPAEAHLEAMAHARICAHCAAALRAMDEIEETLAAAPAPAPAGFADRVMARVAATPRARMPVFELLPFLQTFPWWVRVMREPASVLALLLASVLVARGDRLFALATGGAAQLAAWLARTFPGTGVVSPAGGTVDPWFQPVVLSSLAMAAAPLLLMGSRLLYSWSATLVGPRRARPRGR